MSSPHRIDPSRLEILRSQREASFSASREVAETIRELSTARSRCGSEIHRVTYDASQNIGWVDPAQRQKRIDELNAEIKKIDEKMEQAKADQEPLNERRQAIGQLYARCAEFLGVDPNGR